MCKSVRSWKYLPQLDFLLTNLYFVLLLDRWQTILVIARVPILCEIHGHGGRCLFRILIVVGDGMSD